MVEKHAMPPIISHDELKEVGAAFPVCPPLGLLELLAGRPPELVLLGIEDEGDPFCSVKTFKNLISKYARS